jgi:L-lactate dehydrogenase (cytochrome)
LVVKGILSPNDCELAVKTGADAIMLSNHGGRQLEGTGAPLDFVQQSRERVGDTAQLILDGGIRRGIHVLKAIALGADACSIGRPYLYGLAAAGEAGVRKALSIFRAEIERGMALMGKTHVADITAADVEHFSHLNQLPPAASLKQPRPRPADRNPPAQGRHNQEIRKSRPRSKLLRRALPPAFSDQHAREQTRSKRTMPPALEYLHA